MILTPVRDRPDMRFLNIHVRKQLCAEGPHVWKDLGIELLGAESNHELEVIEHDNIMLIDRCSSMLKLWLIRQPTASWRQLIQALKQIHLTHVAHQIGSKLTRPDLDFSFGLL